MKKSRQGKQNKTSPHPPSLVQGVVFTDLSSQSQSCNPLNQ